MTQEIREFISRLKTVKNKACDERVTVKTIYDRAYKGIYQMIEIDRVKFIVEPENKEEKK